MKGHRIVWAVMLPFAVGLYLFANGTASRLLLVSVILLPPLSALLALLPVKTPELLLDMLSWLRLRGMKERNSPYSAYAHEVEVLLSDAYGSSYQQAVLLWQEAAYSSHAMTDAQCDDMRRIMKETQTLVWNSLGYWKRLLARYRYALI